MKWQGQDQYIQFIYILFASKKHKPKIKIPFMIASKMCITKRLNLTRYVQNWKMLNITQRIKELNKWRDTVLSWIRSQDADSPLIDL